ncbi:MAG: hypothetical protein JSV00_05440 [bacterium]|nr:MAG: hypothetical protein JSV00_05440 [bacterium]
MKEHTVRVIETVVRTPTATSVRMAKPEGFTFQPGQWASFTMKVEEGSQSKPLSFSSSPTEPFLEFTKRITESPFSTAISRLKPGDRITLKGPVGNLVYTGGRERVTFIAGGIGITPIRSILKHALDEGVPGEKYFLYGNRNLEEIAFADELRSWEGEDPDLKVFHVLLEPPEGWEGFTGFIKRDIIREAVPDLPGQTFFVSGPPPMVGSVMKCLDSLGIDRSRVVKEELKGYEGMV